MCSVRGDGEGQSFLPAVVVVRGRSSKKRSSSSSVCTSSLLPPTATLSHDSPGRPIPLRPCISHIISHLYRYRNIVAALGLPAPCQSFGRTFSSPPVGSFGMPAKRKASATASAGSPASATSAAVPPVKKARVAAAEPAEAAAPPVAEAPPSVSTTSARQPEAGPSSRPARTKAKVATVPRPKKRKLAPPKPPGAGLPAGAAVTGPTGQIKGRDVVLVSRRAELGSYMRKCKALMVEEGCVLLVRGSG